MPFVPLPRLPVVIIQLWPHNNSNLRGLDRRLNLTKRLINTYKDKISNRNDHSRDPKEIGRSESEDFILLHIRKRHDAHRAERKVAHSGSHVYFTPFLNYVLKQTFTLSLCFRCVEHGKAIKPVVMGRASHKTLEATRI